MAKLRFRLEAAPAGMAGKWAVVDTTNGDRSFFPSRTLARACARALNDAPAATPVGSTSDVVISTDVTATPAVEPVS